MHAYIKLTLLVIVLSFPVLSYGQQSRKRVANSKTTSTFSEQKLKNYTDSLAIYKKQLDSLIAQNDSLREELGLEADGRYFRLFTPMKYYKDVTGRSLKLNAGNPDEIDQTIMSLYLARPDLLKNNAADNAVQADAKEDKKPQRVEMVKQVTGEVPVVTPEAEIEKEPMNLYVAKPNFWTFKGDYYLQLLQNYVSDNWYKSGSNTYSMMGSVTLQYNYNNKQKVKWDNKLEMKLGFLNSESDTVHKFKASEDQVRLTSKAGLQAHKNWYYSAQFIAETQFTKGLKDNQTKVFSDFMSPFNLNVSVGMDYTVKTKNNKLSGNIHLAPLAYNFKYVDRKDLAAGFGVKGDHRSLDDFGSEVLADLTWKPLDNMKWQTRFYAYTTYHKFLMEWENTLTFQFNKYLSTKLFLYPRFDDGVNRKDDKSYWQFKEYLSLGFSYSM